MFVNAGSDLIYPAEVSFPPTKEEKKHAILGPSKADQWMTCLGSTALGADLPNVTSAYADDGTDHHEVAAYCLEEGVDAASLVGRPMLSGAPLTEENAEFVQKYLDFARSHRDEGGIALVEEEVPISHLTGEPDAKGTSDYVVLRTDRELVVDDLKFGRGVEVAPENNRQAMMYALGVIEKHQVHEDYDTVRIGISQPRNGGNKEWVVSMKDLLAFGEEVKATAKKIIYIGEDGQLKFVPNLPLTPSEKACRFCKAKAICPALMNQVVGAMIEGFDALDPAPIKKDELIQITQGLEGLPVPDRLGKMMAIADLAELWIKSVRGMTESELLAGRPVTGFKLVQGKKGNRQWIDSEAVEEQMKKFRLKKDEMYNYSIISPTAAQKLLEKTSPKRWEILKGLYSQAEGGIHVAPLDDKRETYVPEKAEDGFGEVVDTVDDGSDLI